MKNKLHILLFLVVVAAAIFMTGCTPDPTAGFKNPKSIEYKAEKGTIKLTYDDDGSYEVVENKPFVTLKNRDANFRIDIEYSSNTVSQQNTTKENFKKDKDYTVIDVVYRGYKGYAMIRKDTATANIYLVFDEANDVISNIKVSPVMTSGADEELAKGTNPEDVLFYQEKVQQILKTVQYEK